MAIFSFLTKTGSRVARSLGSSPARAGAAGAAGGLLLDDVPVLSGLDPTEGGGGSGQLGTLLLLLVFLIAIGTVVDFDIGGS